MKKIIVPLMLILLSIIMRLAYTFIGSDVLVDGTLVEPFYLIGLSSIFILVAIGWTLVVLIRDFADKQKRGV